MAPARNPQPELFLDVQNLQIDPQRLWDTLMETARIGATPKGGICRLTLTDLDRQVRDLFRDQCEALRCPLSLPTRRTTYVVGPGGRADNRPIAIGSHL